MGMDIYGNAPTASEGEYFRNNVWAWKPLADYLVARYPDATNPCQYWWSNDGDGLNGAESVRLADLIDLDLSNGHALAYAQRHDAVRASLPRESCPLCEGTGVRTDAVGVAHGFDKPRDPETGTGGCNGCLGEGTRESFQAAYWFSVDNLREFATFAHHSGGFRIC